jgi:hypothetical protein
MKLFFSITAITLLSCFFSHSQTITVSGYVTDATTGENLIGASVYEAGIPTGISTNRYGFYSISLPAGPVRLVSSYVGYQSDTIVVRNLQKDTVLAVRLKPATTQLEAITVQSQGPDAHQQRQLGLVSIPIERLNAVPPLLGEPDIIKALALTPGVSVGNEGTTGLLVRGGTPDQNLILLDEATVYNASHLFGFVSIFNPDAIRKVDLYKAGFPARFGGRLSSVVDITMKEGNNQEFKGEASVGIISSRLLLEGPLSAKLKGRTSFMLSGRASYLGLLTLPNYIGFKTGAQNQFFTYWLYDTNAKLNHRFKDGSHLFFSFYRGNDMWRAQEGSREERSKYGLTWGNATATTRYYRPLSSRLFFRTLLAYSRYGYGMDIANVSLVEGKEIPGTSFSSWSRVRDWTGKAGFDYFPNAAHQFKFGMEFTYHTYRPSHITTTYPVQADSLRKINAPIEAGEYTVYAEDEIQVTSHLRTNVGVRGVAFGVQGRNYTSLEPRASATYALPNQMALKGAYSLSRQFVHQLSSNSIGLPNDIWVPATRQVLPQLSHQFAAGITKTFQEQNLELSLEGYYKTFKHLIDYRTGTNFLTGYDQGWENLIEKNGVGKAYGAELLVNKTQGRFTGWAAYTLAWNRRKFDNINGGSWHAASFDRRHTIALTGNYIFNKKVNLSATWSFHSGQPATVPVAIRQDFEDSTPIFIYGDRNNFRMPVFHRLDIGANFNRQTRRGRAATWSIGLYNAYNRANPYYLDFKKLYFWDEDLRAKTKGIRYTLVRKSVIPILPYVSYSLKF